MTFEDLHAYKATGYYLVPNEDTVEWRNLVKGLRVERAAAICSSGEVGLIAMLPTVRKELVLVDHSYASLAVAMLKYAMLRELGATETRRLLTTVDAHGDLTKNLGKFVKTLPKAVQEAYHSVVQKRGSYDGDFVANLAHVRYNYDKIDPVTGYYQVARADDPKFEVSNKLRREWDKLPQRDVARCAAKLDKVKFLHGDLHDLAERGPFDLLYLSNALEHSGRNGAPDIKQVAACMRPGGYVILAHRGSPIRAKADSKGYRPSYYSPTTAQKANDNEWEVVSTVKSKANMGWQQTLYRLPTEQAVAA